MQNLVNNSDNKFDKQNAFLAAVVFLISFIVYAMTVQQSLSFWDCGEFIASATILGIPHPPGTPVLMLLGRIFSIIPFVEDVSHRINYLTVISSAFTTMFSYLVIVRLVKYITDDSSQGSTGRFIAYIGGVAGSLFVAFSATNWANSVEAEAYGLALAISVAVFWLTLRFHEERGTYRASQTMMLALYLASLGVGIHMTVFLVVPVCAIFFVLKNEAEPKHYMAICLFAIIELLMVMLFSDGRGGAPVFKMMTVIFGVSLFVWLRSKINWGILIAIASISTMIVSFSLYINIATPIGLMESMSRFVSGDAGAFDVMATLPFGLIAVLLLPLIAKKYNINLHWKTGLAVLFVGFLGFSTHFYIPIRSEHNPRIDENNPSRNYATFISFLDRKQYGQVSMTDRMFKRRGLWENQLGRHPHMGFWSYFEEQYSAGGLYFFPFLALGLLGMIIAIRKRWEIGMPFFTLFILGSLGLILYMNFADGTQYRPSPLDAYLEVRNRDYFFTPAFVFFSIAMGLGISTIVMWLRDSLAKGNDPLKKTIVYACTVLVALPGISLAKNYHMNDRSNNFIAMNYAKSILDSCPPNAILFTAGDNDTFPVWCVQESYNYRKDVRVVNLSLLNTDWYVQQMKNRYNVPISLTDEQIVWHPFEYEKDVWGQKPLEPFYDKPRRRQTYMTPSPWDGRLVKVQDMMVDEIVIENKWENPICFNSLPYAESPLKLRDICTLTGMVYILDPTPDAPKIDFERSLELFNEVYKYEGYGNSDVYRDENATGVFFSIGVNAVIVADGLFKAGDSTRAEALLDKMTKVYPEFWQSYLALVDLKERTGDSTKAKEYYQQLHDTLVAFTESNHENLFYLQDLGLVKFEIGRREGNQAKADSGLAIMREAFDRDRNSSYAYKKLVTSLNQARRYGDMSKITAEHAAYGINRNDPLVRQILGAGLAAPPPNRR